MSKNNINNQNMDINNMPNHSIRNNEMYNNERFPNNQPLFNTNPNNFPNPESFNTVVKNNNTNPYPLSQSNKEADNFDLFTDQMQSRGQQNDHYQFFNQRDGNYHNVNAGNNNPSSFNTMKQMDSGNMGFGMAQNRDIDQNQHQHQHQPVQNLYNPIKQVNFGNDNQMKNNFNQDFNRGGDFRKEVPVKNTLNPYDFMTTVNMQSTNNATGKFGNMLAQSDLFASADAGYNPGSLADGFNTMAPVKQK